MIESNRSVWRRCRVLLLLTVWLFAVLAVSSPAAAHDDEGVLEVSAVPAGRTVEYVVIVTYVGDGHPAQGATATVVAEQDGRLPIGPVVLAGTGEPGRYRAEITFPSDGAWTVRFSSLSPIAYLERIETITAAPSAGTSAVAPGDATTTAASAAPSASTSAATVAVGSAPPTRGAAPVAEGERSGSGSVVFYVMIGVIAAGAIWLVVSSKRRRTKARP